MAHLDIQRVAAAGLPFLKYASSLDQLRTTMAGWPGPESSGNAALVAYSIAVRERAAIVGRIVQKQLRRLQRREALHRQWDYRAMQLAARNEDITTADHLEYIRRRIQSQRDRGIPVTISREWLVQ